MMTSIRAKQILASYGAKPENWPVEERQLLQHNLLSNTELQKIQQHELQLDDQLVKVFSTREEADTQFLQKRILAHLENRKTISNSPATHFLPGINKSLLNSFNLLLNPVRIIATVMIVMLVTVVVFNLNDTSPSLLENSMEDELLLMAEALEDANELELLAVLEPELYEELI